MTQSKTVGLAPFGTTEHAGNVCPHTGSISCWIDGSTGASPRLSQRNALRLRLTVRDQTESCGLFGFRARFTSSDTGRGCELGWELIYERDQHRS
jgi:hypothetical protein